MGRSLPILITVALSTFGAHRATAIGPLWAEMEVAAVTGAIGDVGRIPVEIDLRSPAVFVLDVAAPPSAIARSGFVLPDDDPAPRVWIAPTVEVNLAPCDDLMGPRGSFGDWDAGVRASREEDAALFVARLTLRF